MSVWRSLAIKVVRAFLAIHVAPLSLRVIPFFAEKRHSVTILRPRLAGILRNSAGTRPGCKSISSRTKDACSSILVVRRLWPARRRILWKRQLSRPNRARCADPEPYGRLLPRHPFNRSNDTVPKITQQCSTEAGGFSSSQYREPNQRVRVTPP